MLSLKFAKLRKKLLTFAASLTYGTVRPFCKSTRKGLDLIDLCYNYWHYHCHRL